MAKLKGRNVVIPWIEAHKNFRGDECLIWPFTFGGNGYGWVSFQGKASNASRIMCLFAHGNPPESAVTAHSCDNKQCVNPRHLRWASQSENLLESAERRLRSYECKLTDEDVDEIRRLEGTATRQKIAQRFGVHLNQIYRIHKRLQRAVPRAAASEADNKAG